MLWAVSRRNENLPWDPEPNAELGTHVLVPDTYNGQTSYTSRPPRKFEQNPKLYVSHFATCKPRRTDG